MKKCPVCNQEHDGRFCPACGFDSSRNGDGIPSPAKQSAPGKAAQNRPAQYSQSAPQQNFVQQQGYTQQQGYAQQHSYAQKRKNGSSATKKAGILIILLGILILALGVFFILMFGGEEDPCAKGHDWIDATCEEPKTCSVCGETEGSAPGHRMADATCTAPMTCSVCGKTEGSTADHIWIDATCETPKECQVCHTKEGSALGHNPTEATYNDPSICSRCQLELGSPKAPASPLNLSDIITSSKASSVYSGDDLGTHSPDNLYDGLLITNWTEDVDGYGINEYVIFYFDDTYAVNSLTIWIGSHYNETKYLQNSRPKTILLTFSDGSTHRIPLADTYYEQTIPFDRFYYTSSIKITIEDVYPGTKYDDTIIAELDFAAYRP